MSRYGISILRLVRMLVMANRTRVRVERSPQNPNVDTVFPKGYAHAAIRGSNVVKTPVIKMTLNCEGFASHIPNISGTSTS